MNQPYENRATFASPMYLAASVFRHTLSSPSVHPGGHAGCDGYSSSLVIVEPVSRTARTPLVNRKLVAMLKGHHGHSYCAGEVRLDTVPPAILGAEVTDADDVLDEEHQNDGPSQRAHGIGHRHHLRGCARAKATLPLQQIQNWKHLREKKRERNNRE